MIKPVHMSDYCEESPIDKKVEFCLHDFVIRRDEFSYVESNILNNVYDNVLGNVWNKIWNIWNNIK